MTDWKEFFEYISEYEPSMNWLNKHQSFRKDTTDFWELLYQNFKSRMIAEQQQKIDPEYAASTNINKGFGQ